MNNPTVYKSDIVGESYSEYVHPSGLKIYVFPKKMSTSFALFGTKYGSIHNEFTTADGDLVCVPDGVAHFLEHKLFCCEDGSDAFEHFSALGADANAYTTFNRTAYHFSSTDNFYDSLCELTEFVTHPYFTPETVASEVGIISEEIAMYDDSPSDRCFYGMLEGMYQNHPVKRNICGSKSSIRQISAKTLYDCYGAFYRPDNMVIILCGDIDVQRALGIIDSHLPEGFVAGAPEKPCLNEREPREVAKSLVEQKMQVAKPLFCIGFKDTDIPQDACRAQKKSAVMAIVNEILFSRSGELYSRLFEGKLISPAMSYGYTCTHDFAYCSVEGEADNPRLVLEEIQAHIRTAIDNGLDKDEFDRAKRVMYAESVRAFDSVEGIGNTLFAAVSDGSRLFEYTELLSSVSYDDAQGMLKEFYSTPCVTLSIVTN